MTIAEYLQNPYGKGSAFGYNKQKVLDLNKELESLADKMTYKIYRYRDTVVYHVVIPSTKNENVTYDVIIEVETKRQHEGSATIDNLDFKAFSNCPSFIFTYAHVFRKYKMLCEWLLDKYNEEVRKNAPEIRNRFNVIGVERSLYLAMKFIHFKGLTRNTTFINTGVKVTNRNEIAKNVRTQAEVMEKVKAKVKPDPNKVPLAKGGEPEKAKIQPARKPQNPTPSTKEVKSVGKGKSTKRTKTVKSSKKTKKT